METYQVSSEEEKEEKTATQHNTFPSPLSVRKDKIKN